MPEKGGGEAPGSVPSLSPACWLEPPRTCKHGKQLLATQQASWLSVFRAYDLSSLNRSLLFSLSCWRPREKPGAVRAWPGAKGQSQVLIISWLYMLNTWPLEEEEFRFEPRLGLLPMVDLSVSTTSLNPGFLFSKTAVKTLPPWLS